VLALARTFLGLIRPLRHGCVPFPRSTFAVRATKHTTGWRPASLRTMGVGPSRSGSRFYRWADGRSNPGPMVLIHCPADSAAAIVARPPARTAQNDVRSRPGGGLISPRGAPRRSVRSTSD
jgi:hypothetical protein